MENSNKKGSFLTGIILLGVIATGGTFAYFLLFSDKIGNDEAIKKERVIPPEQSATKDAIQLGNDLLSKSAFTNSKYGVTMYPPDGWYAKQDDYFNAQILFLDHPMPSISDFSTQDAIIILSIYPTNSTFFSVNGYIDEVDREMQSTIQLAKSAGDEVSMTELSELNRKYSLFKSAVSNKKNITIDGIDGVLYNYGDYFGSSGVGSTVLLEKNNKLFVLIAEVRDESIWLQNKDKIMQSMMSLKFAQ